MSFLLSNIIILRILIKSVKLIWTFIFAFKFIEYSLQTNSIKLHIYFRKLSSLKVILLKKGKGKKTPKRYYMLQRISWWWFNNNATNKPNYLTLQLPDPVKNYLWWLMTHYLFFLFILVYELLHLVLQTLKRVSIQFWTHDFFLN